MAFTWSPFGSNTDVSLNVNVIPLVYIQSIDNKGNPVHLFFFPELSVNRGREGMEGDIFYII